MSKGNRARRRAAGLLPEPAKCSARTSKGNPCKNAPMNGTNVCRKHGGAAPQVRKKAQERLQLAVLPLLGHLYKMATDDGSLPPAVKLAAIRDMLDRAGITSKLEIEIDVPWRDIISGIVAEVDDDQIANAQQYTHRLHPLPPREVEDYVDAEVVEEDASARAEAERVKGRPAADWVRPPGSGAPMPVPERRPTGPRTRQADVRAD